MGYFENKKTSVWAELYYLENRDAQIYAKFVHSELVCLQKKGLSYYAF